MKSIPKSNRINLQASKRQEFPYHLIRSCSGNLENMSDASHGNMTISGYEVVNSHFVRQYSADSGHAVSRFCRGFPSTRAVSGFLTAISRLRYSAISVKDIWFILTRVLSVIAIWLRRVATYSRDSTLSAARLTDGVRQGMHP